MLENPICPRPDCGEQLTSEDGKPFFPDKFVRKEIGKFSVKCPHHEQGCTWRSTYFELEKHIAQCLYVVKPCPYCNEMFPVANNKFDDHVYDCPSGAQPCPFKGCSPTKKFTKRELEKHILGDGLLQHMLLVGENMSVHEKKGKRIGFDGDVDRGTPYGNASTRGRDRDIETDGVEPIVQSMHLSHNVASKYEVDQLRALLAQKDSLLQNLQEKITYLKATIQAKATENEDRHDDTMLPWHRTGQHTSSDKIICPFLCRSLEKPPSPQELYNLVKQLSDTGQLPLLFNIVDEMKQFRIVSDELEEEKASWNNYPISSSMHSASQLMGDQLCILLEKKDSLIQNLQEKITCLEAIIQAKAIENEDRDFRLSLMENSNHDGTMFISLSELMQGGFIVDDTVFIKVKVDTSSIS